MAFKDTLTKALYKAAELHNAGADDATAVAKTAAAFEFTPDQTQRLLESYNSAKTLSHFKQAEDRTAAFPLAEPEAVFAQLYPASEKKAGRAVSLVDSFYSRQLPAWEVDPSIRELPGHVQPPAVKKLMADTGHQKVASADQLDPVLLDTVLCERRADKLLRLAAKTASDYQATMRKLAAAVQQHRVSMTDLVKRATQDQLGDVTPILVELAEAVPALRKSASARDYALDFVTPATPVYELMAEAQELRQHHQLAVEGRAFFQKAAREAPMLRAKADGLTFAPTYEVQLDFPFAVPAPDWARQQARAEAATKQAQVQAVPAELRWPGLHKASQPKPAAGGGGTATSFNSRTPTESAKAMALTPVSDSLAGAQDIMALLDKATRGTPSLMQDGMEARRYTAEQDRAREVVRNTQRELVLNRLMNLDPILRKADPNRVARAYSTLWTVAPDVAADEEIAKSVLRAAVNATSFSSFDAKNLTELNNAILQQANIAKGLPAQGVAAKPSAPGGKPA